MQCALWGEKETKQFGPLAGVLLDVIIKGSGSRRPKAQPRVAIAIEDMAYALEWFRKDVPFHFMNASSIQWGDSVERRITSCQRQYGPCQFRSLCLRGRAGANGFVLKDGTSLAQWKPSNGREVPPWQ